jgi:uncharacterized protein
MLALALLGLTIGFLIGLVGIGGVLMAPAMALLTGRNIHETVALSLASFVAAGAVAAVRLRGTGLRTADLWLVAALVPGALAGTLATPYIPARALAIAIALCVVFAGVSCLRIIPAEGEARSFGTMSVIIIGLLSGFISVVSGNGGPLVLVPLLLWSGMEVRRTLAVSQIAQLPVAATATVANAVTGALDVTAALVLTLGVVAGMVAGLEAARRMDANRLRGSIAWCLVVAGAALLASDVWPLTH